MNIIDASVGTATGYRRSGYLRTGGYRAPQAAVLVDGNVQVMSEATGTSLAAPASGDAVVTLLY